MKETQWVIFGNVLWDVGDYDDDEIVIHDYMTMKATSSNLTHVNAVNAVNDGSSKCFPIPKKKEPIELDVPILQPSLQNKLYDN